MQQLLVKIMTQKLSIWLSLTRFKPVPTKNAETLNWKLIHRICGSTLSPAKTDTSYHFYHRWAIAMGHCDGPSIDSECRNLSPTAVK